MGGEWAADPSLSCARAAHEVMSRQELAPTSACSPCLPRPAIPWVVSQLPMSCSCTLDRGRGLPCLLLLAAPEQPSLEGREAGQGKKRVCMHAHAQAPSLHHEPCTGPGDGPQAGYRQLWLRYGPSSSTACSTEALLPHPHTPPTCALPCFPFPAGPTGLLLYCILRGVWPDFKRKAKTT